MAEVALSAAVRRTQGSADSRRLRAAGKIPGVLYGHGTDPTPLAIEGRSLRLALNTDAGLNALIQLDLDGTKHLALARDIQRHPVRNTVSHVDFQVVGRNEMMSVDINLTIVGEADAVTKNGGVVEQLLQSLAVQAIPTNIPNGIEIDISELELDGAIRVKDVKLPSGVTTSLDPEEPIVVAKATRAEVETEATGEGDATAATETPADAPAEG